MFTIKPRWMGQVIATKKKPIGATNHQLFDVNMLLKVVIAFLQVFNQPRHIPRRRLDIDQGIGHGADSQSQALTSARSSSPQDLRSIESAFNPPSHE
jgi:hypothetical protein